MPSRLLAYAVTSYLREGLILCKNWLVVPVLCLIAECMRCPQLVRTNKSQSLQRNTYLSSAQRIKVLSAHPHTVNTPGPLPNNEIYAILHAYVCVTLYQVYAYRRACLDTAVTKVLWVAPDLGTSNVTDG